MPSRIPTQAGKHSIAPQDRVEIIDLYLWGARVKDIEMLYGVSKFTLAYFLNQNGVPRRGPARPLVVCGPMNRKYPVKSNRPPKPEDAAICFDPHPSVDQLIRSSAHAQRDRRIAKRQEDESRRSCQAVASASRSGF